jgi:protein-disulfide isomerase
MTGSIKSDEQKALNPMALNKGMILVGLAGVVIGGGAVGGLAATGNITGHMDRAEIENIVRDYLMTHPEIIPAAMERLQQREQAKQVATYRDLLEKPFAGAWAGNEKGDVVLVEFFDYACGYCRTSVKDVDRLLASDPKLKIVFRELPILSAESEQAAKASLSAAQSGKFYAFHSALFAAGPLSTATLNKTVDQTGIVPQLSDPAIAQELEKNVAIARKLGFSGTPTFVIGDRVISGAVGYDTLRKAVDETRKARIAGQKD